MTLDVHSEYCQPDSERLAYAIATVCSLKAITLFLLSQEAELKLEGTGVVTPWCSKDGYESPYITVNRR